MQGAEYDEFVERVSERSDIYSVVSRYVPLTQKSGRYWGRCPFHNEKTPSFCVTPEKKFFYCFGCGAGGNVFKFLSLIENISYFEAIKLQAERLGIELPAKKISPEEERRRQEEKTLLTINQLAQDFYHECLIKTARGEVGRKYLSGRGITTETIETFKLGYAPDEWENLLSRLTRQDFLPQKIEAAGLIAKRKNSAGYYDRFRGRVMIPIADGSGHVVGFGGRILKDDDNSPKYLNTPETALFNKRNLLFGLDKSSRAINAAGFAIVVEGYMDAISLYSAGVKNVVATLGTAFTAEHVKLILRYARKMIFCYDSDEAGQRATLRALPIVQSAGAEVHIVQVPDGKDPDEFIRKHGKVAFDALVAKAQTLIDYRMKYVLTRADLTTVDGKKRALQEILPVVANVTEVVKRNEYKKEISAALFLPEDIVAEEWKNFSRNARQESDGTVKRNVLPKDDDPVIREACENILRMVWHEDDILDYVLEEVSREIFSEPQREIISWLEKCVEKKIRPDELSAAKFLSEKANTELSRILTGGASDPRETEMPIFHDSIDILKRANLKKRYDKLMAQIDGYTSADVENYSKLIAESLKIKQEMDKLKGN